MSKPETVIVAHRNGFLKAAFPSWDQAREWRDAVNRSYILSEVFMYDE